MFDITKKTIEWAGRELTLESGRIARQADGAVLATYGDTSVLCTVVGRREPKPGQSFFPLTVNYQEKTFAAGRIPGGFFKREGRPTEKETLTSRLIDRPLRPLFAPGFKNEVQVVCTVMSHDLENDPDVVAMIGASAALTISGIPFMGPIGAARIGYDGSDYVVNPAVDEVGDLDLDLVMAGTQDAVMMVESQASELSEEVMLGAVMKGHEASRQVIDLIISFAEQCAKEPWDYTPPDHSAHMPQVEGLVGEDIRAAYGIQDKSERVAALNAAKSKAKQQLAASDENPDGMDEQVLSGLLKELESNTVRGAIIDGKPRIDGRDTKTIRPIIGEVGILPRTHGSALFTRGETQSIVVATLGTSDDEQYIDALEGTYKENFLLHYNFPPYSVGETGRMGSPGRREIGHGKLAWRAVKAVLPSQEEFPYVIRLVSEITESNGSSSMATVCGSSLAMMDAGVPIKRAVAGIAMGLILEGDKHAVLSDILGDEDHLGDMDFKVAGTDQGVTSLQMDIKVAGITEDIMRTALDQAKDGRIHILGEMAKAMSGSREDLGEFAPRIEQIQIPKEKIREVIGTGGKVIRQIVEETGAKVNVDDEGLIKVATSDKASIDAAIKWIKSITDEPEVGEIYKGKVVKTMDFGAFVNFFGPRDGLVHISQLSTGRPENTTDIVKEGDEVWVKLLGFDDRGKTKLSMKVVDQETGKEVGKDG